ncbi:ABC transporter permease [Hoyosella rhizosphaerae]|uniref:Cell division protein FtsX n=1 Tax=Hoyosella rhizosphaerae TaxID=1755582 RepID=A0A916UC18_9ACTN|nr:permease-like cell division protein FtsX [Hoyosella rhizosphaerae]MBN4925930.1 ABC transporter permease [Hoyosella rhizosphaerae]GGC66851.1 cell division protein FtsX [Hoyosella rhizosphaerae]
MRFTFLIREVFSGLSRNITMTLAMVITTAISLGIFGGGLLVIDMTNKTQKLYLDNVEVEVFLSDDISTSDPGCVTEICSTLDEDLREFPGVTDVTYISRDDAVAIYRDTFASNPEILDLVRPEALPASFLVRLDDPEQFGAIYDEFALYPGVESVRNQEELVQRLFSVLNGLRNGAFIIATVQGAAALMLIANMVQITAFTRRDEVSIMRLVGATRWYTQLPFLLEAVVAALAGAALAVGGLFLAKNAFVDSMLAEVYQSNIVAPITNAAIVSISPLLIGLAAVLSAATGYLTLRLYVRE